MRPPKGAASLQLELRRSLAFDRIAAERRVLLPDLQSRLISLALVPLLHRVHAVPSLDRDALRRRSFHCRDGLGTIRARATSDPEAGAASGEPLDGATLDGMVEGKGAV